MSQAEALVAQVVERLSTKGLLQLEDLAALIPACTWNQLFTAIDRLSLEGLVELRHPDR